MTKAYKCPSRCKYDKLVVEGGYGKLLSTWDKRERHGADCIDRSQMTLKNLDSMYKFTIHQESSRYLSQLIQFPYIFDPLDLKD